MSISPQSLARTRDKRSLRIPARFDDFSEIPPEVTFRNVTEALKLRRQPAKRVNVESLPEQSSKKLATETAAKRPAPRQRSSTPAPAEPQQETLDESPEPKDPPSDATDIDLECKETAPNINDLKLEPEQVTEQKSETVTREEGTDDVDKAKTDHVENLADVTKKLPQFLLKSDHNPAITELDGSVFINSKKKSPFHPSITISNGCRMSGLTKKHASPNEKKQITTPANAPCSSKSAISTPTSSSKKKSKGLSLMAKPNNGPFQANTVINNRPIAAGAAQQPTKYFNNVPQTMQYGTRLMLNEPIYLPRSVNTIAPITTTLQQIVNHAKRPPFLSKRAEAFIAYQEDRKLNYMASNYTALVKITKYLEVRDLLNLRLVNKSWKSIVSSEDVWKKVVIKSSMINDWPRFISKVLCKYQTKDLILDEYCPNIPTSEIIEAIVDHQDDLAIRRLWIRTIKPNQNTFAMELICGLNTGLTLQKSLRVIWKVRITITGVGIALVALQCPSEKSMEQKIGDGNYCYERLKLDHDDNQTEEFLVELDVLRALYNGNENDTHNQKKADGVTKYWQPKVHVKAI